MLGIITIHELGIRFLTNQYDKTTEGFAQWSWSLRIIYIYIYVCVYCGISTKAGGQGSRKQDPKRKLMVLLSNWTDTQCRSRVDGCLNLKEMDVTRGHSYGSQNPRPQGTLSFSPLDRTQWYNPLGPYGTAKDPIGWCVETLGSHAWTDVGWNPDWFWKDHVAHDWNHTPKISFLI